MAAHNNPTALTEAQLEQRRLKADLIAESYALVGLDVIALGDQDWILGTDWLQDMVKRHELPVVAANLQCQGSKPYPGHKVVEVDGRRLGIIGVTLGPVQGCEVSDAHAAILGELQVMGEVDVTIGLIPGKTPVELAPILEPAPPLDLVLDGRGRHSANSPEKMGQSILVSAGTRGKSLGQASLTWVEGASGWSSPGERDKVQSRLDTTLKRLADTEARLTGEKDERRKAAWERQIKSYRTHKVQLENQLQNLGDDGGGTNQVMFSEVSLTATVSDHEATRVLVDKAKGKMGEVTLAPKLHLAPHVAPHDSVYAGSQACKSCHPTQFAQWAQTAHASAYQSLVEQRSHMDDSCWHCHVTGAKQEGGPQTAVDVRGLRDVQCEACHGPARAHISDPSSAALKPSAQVPQSNCVNCHDGQMDEGRFNYETYLPKVIHSK